MIAHPLPSTVRTTEHDTRADWLAARGADIAAGFVGSTTVAAILGRSNYAGPWDVWARVHAPDLVHRENDDEEQDDDSILARGLAMEPILWQRYRDRFGAQVIEPGHLRCYSGRYAVSPDAFVEDPALGWGVGEAKTVMLKHSHWVPRVDGDTFTIHGLDRLTSWPMPRAYLSQCLAMCIGTGLPFCDLWTSIVIDVEDPRCAIASDEFPGARPHAIVRSARIRVIPTSEDLAALNARVGSWVRRHIVDGKPPPIDDSRTCWLHSLGPDPAALIDKAEATEEQADHIRAYLEGRDTRVTGESDRETARSRLIASMSPAGLRSVYVTRDDGKRITATISRRGRLTITEPKT